MKQFKLFLLKNLIFNIWDSFLIINRLPLVISSTNHYLSVIYIVIGNTIHSQVQNISENIFY